MALAHKGLEPDLVPWRFGQADRLPGAPANRTVPVMVDGDRVVGDSTAIAFHLEQRHVNGPSLFGGAGGEAHARFILAWADTVLMPAVAPIGTPYVFGVIDPADRAYFRATREKRLGTSLAEEKIHLDWARMVQAEAQGQAEIARLAHQLKDCQQYSVTPAGRHVVASVSDVVKQEAQLVRSA